MSPALEWQNIHGTIPPRTYVCGYCGDKVGPDRGYFAHHQTRAAMTNVYVHICSSCRQPTYFDADDRQWPGVAFGTAVHALPTDVEFLYDEARRCMSVAAYNTAVMACRKLLMHIAHERGSGEKKNFKQYLDWLVQEHYVPPGGEGWADHIRDKGNEANHEIALLSQLDAEQVISFTELLLKFVYEMPARVGMAAQPEPPQPG